MTLLNFCGWELGAWSRFTGDQEENWAGGGIEISSVIKRTGNYSLKVRPAGGATGYVNMAKHNNEGYTTGLNIATAYARVYIYIESLPASASEEILQVQHAAGLKFALRITSASKLQAYDNTGTNQLGSDGATTLALNTWHKLNIKAATGVSAAYEIKINGVVELSGTGDLTANNANVITLGLNTNRNGQNYVIYYDDFAVADDDYPADGGVLYLPANADGTYTTWIIGGGSGDKWEQLDEIPYDTSTFLVSTMVIGEAYTAELTDTATLGITGVINAVKPLIAINRYGGYFSSLRLRIRSGGTDYDLDTYSTGTYLRILARVDAVDPATSIAWTLGGLDTLEVGAVEQASNFYRRTIMTLAGAMVDVADPAPTGNIYTYAVEWEDGGTLLGSGQPLAGDRSAYDVINYDTLHAADIAAESLKRHLPAPGTAGNIAQDDGVQWISVDPATIEGLGFDPDTILTDEDGDVLVDDNGNVMVDDA